MGTLGTNVNNSFMQCVGAIPLGVCETSQLYTQDHWKLFGSAFKLFPFLSTHFDLEFHCYPMESTFKSLYAISQYLFNRTRERRYVSSRTTGLPVRLAYRSQPPHPSIRYCYSNMYPWMPPIPYGVPFDSFRWKSFSKCTLIRGNAFSWLQDIWNNWGCAYVLEQISPEPCVKWNCQSAVRDCRLSNSWKIYV